VTVGAGPISLASGEPPCAAQHGPHTTACSTVARAWPTRTWQVTHSSPAFRDPAEEGGASPARSRAATSDMPGVTGSAPGVSADPAHGTAVVRDGVSGAWAPIGVLSPGNTGPRRGSPGMLTPAC
jgi:hypothetical protein